MTNEQAKHEAIKKAYGNHYDIFKPNENGIGSAIGGIDENKYETISNGYVNTYRPKVLNGIEDNNGWIRIEPDGSNLPEYNVSILVLIPDEDDHITSGMWDISNKWVLLDENRVPECQVSHWMRIPQKPVY